MKRILFLLMTTLLAMSSCYDKVSTGANELDFSQLFELETQMETRLDECEVGDEDGKYPQANFDELSDALLKIKEGIKKANAGLFILQFEVDSYAISAKKVITLFDDSKNFTVSPGTQAELYVNGTDNKGHIDFGSSTNFNPANMTIDVWVKYDENYLGTMPTFSSFISTFVSPAPFKGWALNHSAANLRFDVGAGSALPEILTAAPAYGAWFHLAAVIDGTNNMLYMYINGELKKSMANMTPMVPGAAGDESRMWAFVEPIDKSRNMSGYMKNFRLWSTAKSQTEITSLMNSEVTGTEPNLVCAWDFTVKPENDGAIVDKTGGHTAKIVGVYKWKPLTND